MVSGLITAEKSPRRIIFFPTSHAFSTSKDYMTRILFKKIYIILQEKRQGRDLGLNACLLLCGG